MIRTLRIFKCSGEKLFVAKQTYASASVAAANEVSELQNAKPFEDIPGPKSYPLIGNLLSFAPGFGELCEVGLKDLMDYLHKRYGNIVKLEVPGRKNMVFCYEPDDFEKIFRNEGTWPNRPGAETVKYYREVLRRDIYGGVSGLVASQGEEWQTFRSKVNQTMLQPKIAKLYIGPTDEVTGDLIKRLRMLRDTNLEMPDDFVNELQKWAMESVSVVALDTRLGCLNENLKPDSEPQKVIDAVSEIFKTFERLEFTGIPLWKYISTPTWKKFIKNVDFVNEVAIKHINNALKRIEQNPDPEKDPSILERLLARDPEKRSAFIMAQDMMLAGIDTTSYTAANTLYLLAKNSEKQDKLYEEIQKVVSTSDELTAQHLNDLKYLKACIKESMRLTPITSGNIRRLPKDIVLSNYRIPQGTDILTCNSVVCRDEKYYSEPSKYFPERWLKSDSEDMKDQVHPFTLLPFGFGPRMCIGRRLAELELEVLIIRLVQNFKMEYYYADMVYKAAPFLHPALPLKLKMTDR